MRNNQRGSGLLLVIIAIATLFAIVGISLERGIQLSQRVYKNHLEDSALNLAEAGVEYAFHQLVTSAGENFQSKKEVMLETGAFFVRVSHLTDSEMIEIVSTGTAMGKGRINEVVKTLRVLVQPAPENTEQTYVIYSWEESR